MDTTTTDSLLDDMTDRYEPLVYATQNEVDTIDDLVLILSEAEQGDMLRRIANVRKRVMTLQRLMVSKAEVLRVLLKRLESLSYMRDGSLVKEIKSIRDTTLYIGDVQDRKLLGRFYVFFMGDDSLLSYLHLFAAPGHRRHHDGANVVGHEYDAITGALQLLGQHHGGDHAVGEPYEHQHDAVDGARVRTGAAQRGHGHLGYERARARPGRGRFPVVLLHSRRDGRAHGRPVHGRSLLWIDEIKVVCRRLQCHACHGGDGRGGRC